MEEFTEKEREILKPFFTNLDKPVFVLLNLPEVVKGALFSRYSRTSKSLRRVLLDEFIQNPEIGFNEIVKLQMKSGLSEIIATKKAEEFYDRVLVGFGDDSVAELAGVHIACENISQLIAAKEIEDCRIGLSPLEKSTRYVRFDDKVDGKYKYYRDPDIASSKFDSLYEETMDFIFDSYSEMIEPMMEFVSKKFPKQDDITERAYESTIRAKACDVLRQMLPVSTLTNVGIFGNGRAFEYMLTKMYSSPLAEVRDLAQSIHEELNKVIPSFVKRATNERGIVTQNYIKETKKAMFDLVNQMKLIGKIKKTDLSIDVKLIDFDKDAEVKVVAAMIYPYSNLPLEKLRNKVRRMTPEERRRIIKEYSSRRSNRHHKLGRAFENTFYTFDILAPIGSFKDLERHRILTQERQLYTTYYGYDTPKEIIEAGFEKKYRKTMDAASVAFKKISKLFPFQSQYVVPIGYKMRWYFKMNLREVCHLTELRSGVQGHTYYRKIAQMIANEVKKVHPNLAEEATKFVDMKEYDLERLEAEKRIDKKMKEVEEKYGK